MAVPVVVLIHQKSSGSKVPSSRSSKPAAQVRTLSVKALTGLMVAGLLTVGVVFTTTTVALLVLLALPESVAVAVQEMLSPGLVSAAEMM